MKPSRLLLLIMVVLLSPVIVNGQNPMCYDIGNFTANSTFQKNLDDLLHSIATTTSSTMTYGLFNASTSQQQNTEAIEMIGYCRGDLNPDACRACLNTSAYEISRQCPLRKKAVFFEVNCTLKYSNDSLYGELDMNRSPIMLVNTMSVPNWDAFATVLKQLLDDLRDQASPGGALRKYAQGNSSVELTTLYASVQCSPDLSGQQCTDCLDELTKIIPLKQIGARMLWPSCQLRYETSRFFDPVAVPLPSPPSPTATAAEPSMSTQPGENKSSKTWIIVVASTVATLLIGIIILLIAKKRKRIQRLGDEDADEVIVESLQFNLDIITEATENFSNAKKLGQGGFGSVYLGKLPNGQQIAVKRLSKNSGQGELEFKNEVVLLARLQHRNLVRLLGFCLEGSERLLIYEFVQNSSLDNFIFDPLKRALLDWDTRFKIITGISRGLMHLHEDSRIRIIHRDLKASNILLDGDMNPKVSDFGMARLFELDQTQADTNRIVGTYGYMAPEYVLHGHFSVKSDVFSFGVLVLEIVSGRRNLNTSRSGGDPEILISNIWRSWREGKVPSIVDPLVTSGYSADIVRCVHIGLLCVQENEASRPTMASVVLMLNSNSVTLSVPTQPAFLMSTSCYTSEISSSTDGTSTASKGNHKGKSTDMGTNSVNEVSITNPYPR